LGAVSSSVKLALKRFENYMKDKIIHMNDLKMINTLYLADTNNYRTITERL